MAAWDGEDWFIVSDLGCARSAEPAVSARRTLSRPRRRRGFHHPRRASPSCTPVATALDLGTGSGIRRSTPPSTPPWSPRPISTRAPWITRLTALSERRGAPRAGSSLRAGRRRHVRPGIVSNPPFRSRPAPDSPHGRRHGRRRPVPHARAAGGDRLNDGGYGAVPRQLASSRARSGRPAALLVPRGCDAWIVQREVQDVTQYTSCGCATWRPPRRPGRVPAGVRAMAGRVRGEQDQGDRLRLDHPAEERAAWPPARWSRRSSSRSGRTPSSSPRRHRAGPLRTPGLRDRDDAGLLADRFTLAPEGSSSRSAPARGRGPGARAAPAEPGCRATRVDHVAAGFAGVCDGTLSAGRILDAIGQLTGEDPVTLRDRTPQAIRLLVEEGFRCRWARPAPDAARWRLTAPDDGTRRHPTARLTRPDGIRRRIRPDPTGADGARPDHLGPTDPPTWTGPPGPRPTRPHPTDPTGVPDLASHSDPAAPGRACRPRRGPAGFAGSERSDRPDRNWDEG